MTPFSRPGPECVNSGLGAAGAGWSTKRAVLEENYRRWLRSGELVALLDDYLPPFDGFYLYYPSRHNPPPKLRALVEHVRRFRAED